MLDFFVDHCFRYALLSELNFVEYISVLVQGNYIEFSVGLSLRIIVIVLTDLLNDRLDLAGFVLTDKILSSNFLELSWNMLLFKILIDKLVVKYIRIHYLHL